MHMFLQKSLRMPRRAEIIEKYLKKYKKNLKQMLTKYAFLCIINQDFETDEHSEGLT